MLPPAPAQLSPAGGQRSQQHQDRGQHPSATAHQQRQQQPLFPSPARRPGVGALPRLPALPPTDADPLPQWELMSSAAMAAATGGSPLLKLEEYLAEEHGDDDLPLLPPPLLPDSRGWDSAAATAPSMQHPGRDPRRRDQRDAHPHLPQDVQLAAAQMKALMDSTAAFEPARAAGTATTPSSSSSYDAAGEHVMEGLLCPDSVDAMRQWATLLDPSFPAAGDLEEGGGSGLLQGAEVPAALANYKHAALLSEAADMFSADAGHPSSLSPQVCVPIHCMLSSSCLIFTCQSSAVGSGALLSCIQPTNGM